MRNWLAMPFNNSMSVSIMGRGIYASLGQRPRMKMFFCGSRLGDCFENRLTVSYSSSFSSLVLDLLRDFDDDDDERCPRIPQIRLTAAAHDRGSSRSEGRRPR